MPGNLRDQFLLDRDWRFLNHGSFGACPRPVFTEYQRLQRALEAQPVHFMTYRLPVLLQEARERLAAFLNVDHENLIFVSNATSALNLVIRSLDWQAEDEILSSDQEYGALQRTWAFIEQKYGARAREISIEARHCLDENEFADHLWRAVTPRTRAIFLSHITSPTALLFPLRELLRRARAAGILTIIDGAHAPGQIPLDLRALGADVYAGNCHKWLCAPKGSAFLYVRKALHERMVPLVISHGWQDGASFASRNAWYGTQDYAAYLSIPAALDFRAEYDWQAIRAACIEQAQQARAHLARHGFPSLWPMESALALQMFACQLPAGDANAIYRQLWEKHRIEVPVIDWRKQILLRVSIHAYNSEGDWQALRVALQQIFGVSA